MDLCAEMLLDRLAADHAGAICAERVCPPFQRRFGRIPLCGRGRTALNADRLWNRFRNYPKHLKAMRDQFDLFHIIDHSYAHLVHELPAQRTIVTCNDLDAFECLLNPHDCRRSALFRTMTRCILSGLQKAAHVTCISETTRQGLLLHAAIKPAQAETVHLGVDSCFTPRPDVEADREAGRLLSPSHQQQIDLLHVGSTIDRKRIDVLLNVFARVRQRFPLARLLRVGGEFTAVQRDQLRREGLASSVLSLPFIERKSLAAVYRRASLVLQPSENEGFGLPLVEAMACGTPVVASDIGALREVGGEAATYCTVGQTEQWCDTVCRLLREREQEPPCWKARCEAALQQASRFSWERHTKKMVQTYRRVLQAAEAKAGT